MDWVATEAESMPWNWTQGEMTTTLGPGRVSWPECSLSPRASFDDDGDDEVIKCERERERERGWTRKWGCGRWRWRWRQRDEKESE